MLNSADFAPPPELEVVNLTKRFGNLIALNEVSLRLKSGSFQALLGENGAGKSTLVKCIMGFYPPTAGGVRLNGCPCAIANPRDAHRYGIGMVYQHFTSIPAMTVAENLILSRIDGNLLINWKTEFAQLAAFMDTAPFRLPIEVPIVQLSAGEKQKLEILKQLYLNSKILILDEPTSVLTPAEADEILGLLHEQVTEGKLSVLLISHKLREVMAFADEVTVLRKGHVAGNGLIRDLSGRDLAELMIGEPRSRQSVDKTAPIEPVPVLQLQDLHVNKDNGLPAVNGVNLTVCSGEIVGIAGISGNGQRELVEALAGQRSISSGQIRVSSELYRATRTEMSRHGIFLLPEEPLRNACVPEMTVAENLALRSFDRSPQANGIFLVSKAIRQMAQALIETFKVKAASIDAPIEQLSGGNIQRAVLARELSANHIQLLIAANPCFGLDFASVDYIHAQLLAVRNRGVAVLLVGEDLDELLKLSDRLLVISSGQFVYESKPEAADFAAIGRHMAGH